MAKSKNPIISKYADIDRYAGVSCDTNVVRLHYNENLYGPSPKCLDVLKHIKSEDLYLYDSTSNDILICELSKYFNVQRNNIIVNNGSAEIIKSIFDICSFGKNAIMLPNPGYSYYYSLSSVNFCKVITYSVKEGKEACYHDVDDLCAKAKKYKPKLIVITSPSMPTANSIDSKSLERVIKHNPLSIVLVDEAYYGFSKDKFDINYFINKYDNVIFCRTFSKYFALANLRVGFAFSSESLKHAVWLRLPLFKISTISRKIAISALKDDKYYSAIRKKIIITRDTLIKELNKIKNVKAFTSSSNFVYISLKNYDVAKIKEDMQKEGYMIRIFDSNNEKHLRISIGTASQIKKMFIKLKVSFKKYDLI